MQHKGITMKNHTHRHIPQTFSNNSNIYSSTDDSTNQDYHVQSDLAFPIIVESILMMMMIDVVAGDAGDDSKYFDQLSHHNTDEY
jgi:hypothetical protein